MGKGIYTYYKERLIEIGGNNKCLYLKNIVRKGAYDLGRLFEGRDGKTEEFIDFLWSGGKHPLTIISNKEKTDILRNLDASVKLTSRSKKVNEGLVNQEETAAKKADKAKLDEAARVIEAEIAQIKELKREVEEIEKETGRYELFIGYPFVFGCIQNGATKSMIKAPLLLFPVNIDIVDESTVELRLNESEQIRINPALIFSYAQAKKLNVDQLELEFEDISKFKNVKDIVHYLEKAHVSIECPDTENIHKYSGFKEPEAGRTALSLRYAAVIARVPLSNSIFKDYTQLEKQNLTNDAVSELLRFGKKRKLKKKLKSKKPKKRAKKEAHTNSYIIKMLDYAQSEVVRRVDKTGNMVIYGPPGTGKSQTIVNVITDAICKQKRVLVVSQKKAALDVVFNRLGVVNSNAMYINDEAKEKQAFYDRCLIAHQNNLSNQGGDVKRLEDEFNEIENKIQAEVKNLETIQRVLNEPRPFGISLASMYSSSYNIPKNTPEYAIYIKMLDNKRLLSLNYKEMSEALFSINSMKLADMYYNFMQDKEKNPVIDCMLPEIDIRTLGEVKGSLEEIQKSRLSLFAISRHPYYRHVLTYYSKLKSRRNLKRIVKLANKLEHPFQIFRARAKKKTMQEFVTTYDAIKEYADQYSCLNKVLTNDGYLAVIDNVLRGNTAYIELVEEALDNYISTRDLNNLFHSLSASQFNILDFAYGVSKDYQDYLNVLKKILEIRIFHEVNKSEEECQDDLVKLVDFSNITTKIYKLKEQQLAVANKLCACKNTRQYAELYENSDDNKDYLYQISKKTKYWPIRKTMEVYGKYILSLFPCWLLSPENVSNLLPLTKNMFDIVLFDEASQVFIESTIPTIYRGKSIVVAGDDKQLRPSATFMKRYLGADPETIEDVSVQAALEVDSLLDLAVSRYDSANLTYHYRSRHQELIDFSNYAFYGGTLQVAPNISKNKGNRPIERYKVNGKWIDRKNYEEAKQIVDILKKIFATRKHNESIGIITFNSDQQACIADTIDKETAKDAKFRTNIMKETHRIENGEDTSLFIKNLENVQGDERDIIIFSIGYAPNESGKVNAAFGSLSQEGGENRLNVAVTRAKSKIIVVTSIEPEDLKVDGSKNVGPKLLQKYLMYTRAVSKGDNEGVAAVIAELRPTESKPDSIITNVESIEEQMKAQLEKLGYHVDIGLGNDNNRISLAIYDPATDKYLVGVELDTDAFKASSSCLERDVYKPRFLEARGWTIVRVWCRDWWLYPSKVIKNITNIAEKNRKAN